MTAHQRSRSPRRVGKTRICACLGGALVVGLIVWSGVMGANEDSRAARQETGDPNSFTVCDPSYPDVCIPPPPPDLDCSDISQRRFRVIGRDSHRFDGDNDGIGCEGG